MDTETRKKKIVRVTLVGTAGNILLLIFKFVAGFLGRSSAMIADAVHSLSDFVTDLVVLVFINISSRPGDNTHKYGHGKFETLATTIIGLALLVVGFGLMWQGGNKVYGFYFRDEVLESPAYIALVAALVSIIIKEVLYRVTLRAGKECDSQTLIANGWHHRSDAFSSIGTAIGIGGAILLGEKWRVLDPVAAVVVSFLIIKVAFELLIPALNDLLERSLPLETEEEIVGIIEEVPGVSDPHNLRTRRIGNAFAIEAHVRVDKHMPVYQAHELTREIEQKLRLRFGAQTHVAIHIEPTKE
ncbi:MAG: cation diffusion facilitator family transporter [Tannerellaceae bacterium]|nr:cation diffusion facilitator family transporter [Tannerellaceae bacterium]